jgi:sugar lactone lactonase YvrE
MGAIWHVAANVQAMLGEAPVWDDVEQCLWFVDVRANHIHRLNPKTGRVASRPFPGAVSAAIPSRDGWLVVTGGQGVHQYHWQRQCAELVMSVVGDDATTAMNDAACDCTGRLWAGTIDVARRPARSSLFRIDDRGPVAVMSGCELANGIGWSPDSSVMYFADSRRRAIIAFDYEASSGTACNPRAWLRSHGSGVPDGLTVDADGLVWVAQFGAAAVHVYSPDAVLIDVITLPVDDVTNVCFGGRGLTDLYVTSSAHRLLESRRHGQSLAGATFVIPGVGRGLPSHRCDPALLGATHW